MNVDSGFVYRREEFVFLDGIFELVRTGLSLGYKPVVITNQSGIARGLFSEQAYFELTDWMLEVFRAEQAPLAAVYHCPYLPDAPVAEFRHPRHPWRKPAPGMLFAAREELGLDLGRSALVGNRWSDAQAGAAAGLRHLALVEDEQTVRQQPDADPIRVDRLDSVARAVDWLWSKAAT